MRMWCARVWTCGRALGDSGAQGPSVSAGSSLSAFLPHQDLAECSDALWLCLCYLRLNGRIGELSV